MYDNIFVERLWRTVKYEEVYLNDYVSVPVARKGLGDYFDFYNTERPMLPWPEKHLLTSIMESQQPGMLDLGRKSDMNRNEIAAYIGSHGLVFLTWRQES